MEGRVLTHVSRVTEVRREGLTSVGSDYLGDDHRNS